MISTENQHAISLVMLSVDIKSMKAVKVTVSVAGIACSSDAGQISYQLFYLEGS